MLKSIKTNMQSLNKPSSILMMAGTQFCCVLLMIAVYIYIKNDLSVNYSYAVNDFAKTMASVTIFVFAEVIIGSLFMDIYAKRKNIK